MEVTKYVISVSVAAALISQSAGCCDTPEARPEARSEERTINSQFEDSTDVAVGAGMAEGSSRSAGRCFIAIYAIVSSETGSKSLVDGSQLYVLNNMATGRVEPPSQSWWGTKGESLEAIARRLQARCGSYVLERSESPQEYSIHGIRVRSLSEAEAAQFKQAFDAQHE